MTNKPMDRRDFLKATAGTGLAAVMASGASQAMAIGAESNKSAETNKKAFAFFDVDCWHPDQSNSKFITAETAASIGETLKNIYAKAEQLDSPILSLTCLGFQRDNPSLSVKDTVSKERSQDAEKSDVAFVTLDASPEEVKRAISCHQIFLERRAYSSGQENMQQYATDVFMHNTNAVQVVQGLGERHWLVFGRGFKFCVVPTVVGLLAMGKQVTVLEDAIMAGTCSQATNDMTSESFTRNMKYLKSLGAKFARFDSVLAGSST